ncbi:hypothetical protein LXL04_006727 [Taraxacum kok-saghyz]
MDDQMHFDLHAGLRKGEMHVKLDGKKDLFNAVSWEACEAEKDATLRPLLEEERSPACSFLSYHTPQKWISCDQTMPFACHASGCGQLEEHQVACHVTRHVTRTPTSKMRVWATSKNTVGKHWKEEKKKKRRREERSRKKNGSFFAVFERTPRNATSGTARRARCSEGENVVFTRHVGRIFGNSYPHRARQRKNKRRRKKKKGDQRQEIRRKVTFPRDFPRKWSLRKTPPGKLVPRSSHPNNLPLEGLWTNCPQAALHTSQPRLSLHLNFLQEMTTDILSS